MSRPVQVPDLANITDVVMENYLTLIARDSGGSVWAWGGEHGCGAHKLKGLTGVTTIAGAGGWQAFALKNDGTVWAWGTNDLGQLGDGTTTNRVEPIKMKNLTDVVTVLPRFLALKKDGTVWSWGYNGNGSLGDGTTIDRLAPVPVKGLTDVVDIARTLNNGYAVKADGTVWAWGGNVNGELGNGVADDGETATTPVQVSGLTAVRSVHASSGSGHATYALKKDGTLWAWGTNWSGAVGDGTTDNVRHTPAQVKGLTNVVAVTVWDRPDLDNGWGEAAYAITTDGTLWAWGSGFGNVPVQITGLPKVRSITAYGGTSLAVARDGTLWAWGANGSGQLGDGTTRSRATPAQVPGIHGAASAAISGCDSCFVKTAVFAVASPSKPSPIPGTKKLTTTGVPTISGKAKVGKKLTAKPGTWNPVPIAFSYQWYRNSTKIAGATKATYTLTGADKGKMVIVKVTGSKSGYASVTKTSAKTKKIAAGTLTTAKPKITGTPKVGRTLTAKTGTWKPVGVKLRYQWYRSGKKIKGATASTYVLVSKDKGKKITVKVTGKAPGYTTESTTSKTTKKIN